MIRYNKNLGDFGEDTAESYLRDKGYVILERNYRVRGGEIDIVALDEDVLVFVEVKTRSSNRFGAPAEAVDKNKIEHMTAVAEEYYRLHPIDAEVRFDVVEVEASISGGVPEVFGINHITDAITN